MAGQGQSPIGGAHGQTAHASCMGEFFFFFFVEIKLEAKFLHMLALVNFFFLSEMTARKILYAAGVLLVKVPEAGEKENEEETKRGSNRREIEARPGHGQTNL
jgi:hypothetical protein